MFHKSIQYALEKLGKSKSGFERTVVSKFKRKRRVGSGYELVDYSRAPCLGADQKARGLWERDCDDVDGGVAQYGAHTPNNMLIETCSLGLPCTSLILNIHVVSNRHLSKQGICWPVSCDHMAGSSLQLIDVTCCFEVDCWPSVVLDWIAGSCQVNLLKTGQDCSEAG